MPYPPKPDEIDATKAISACEEGWIRCDKCGNLLLYVENAVSAVLLVFCRKCKVTYRLILGVDIDLDGIS